MDYVGDGSYEMYAYYIINCSAGGYAAVGYLTGQGFVSDIYVVRLDDNGDTLWTRQYGTTAIEEGTCIQEADNGNFVISFRAADSSGIFKIDGSGNLIWWKSYNFSSGSHFKNVAVLSSGNYV